MLPTHRDLAPVVTGYELSPDRGYFSVVLPESTINLVSNPSVELDTTGYAAVSSAVIARSVEWQSHGAWGLKVTPTAVATSGVYYGTVALIAGTTYAFSLDFKGQGGQSYTIYFADGSGNRLGAGLTFTGTGTIQRVRVNWTEVLSAARRLYVTKASGGSVAPYYIDGLQVEAKPYATTYCDGDQQGFTAGQISYGWSGIPHASTSWRNGQTRAGGRLVPLLDYGLRVSAVTGLGMPAPDNVNSPYGLLDGSYYQRTNIPARQFALVGSVNGRGIADVQRARAQLVSAFRHDSVGPDQPLLLIYQRGDCSRQDGDSMAIPCVYAGGLEGALDNLYQERLALAFTMFDPYLTLTTDSGGQLDPGDDFTANVGLYQDLNGVWRALSAGGPHLRRVLVTDQGIFLAFMNVAATTFTVYRWDPTSNTLTSLGTSSAGATLYAMHLDTRGRLWIGGAFTTMGGVAVTNAAYYQLDVGFGAAWVAVGDPGMVVRSFTETYVYTTYFIYAGGENTGATLGFVKYWSGGTTWNAAGSGAISDSVYAVYVTPPKNAGPAGITATLFVGGNFATIYGVAAPFLATIPLSTGIPSNVPVSIGTFDDQVSELLALENGHVVAGGEFNTLDGNNMVRVAEWTGQAWQPMGGGLGANLAADCQSLALSPDGLLYAVSPGLDRNGVSELASCGGIAWNGRTWTPIPILSGATNPQCVGAYGVGRLIFGSTSVTNTASGVAEITNNGSAKTYPVIRFRLSGPNNTVLFGLPYVLTNLATGARITFANLFLGLGEYIELDTDPANPSLTSSFYGDVLGSIQAGSDLGGFGLAPGLNRISLLGVVYSGTATFEVAIFWRERHAGVDSATR